MEQSGALAYGKSGREDGFVVNGVKMLRIDQQALKAAAIRDDPRTPTRPDAAGDSEEDTALTPVALLKKPAPYENGDSPTSSAGLAAPVLLEPVYEETPAKSPEPPDEAEGDLSANVSGASSPDVDSDKPLVAKRAIPLQRGDSTSSDSSVSGLSRASSSSSVYATPFRMTPFRTPAAQSRAGSYVGERTSYFQTAPSRFGMGGIASARSSFRTDTNPAARMFATASAPSAHGVAMHALGEEAPAGPSSLPPQGPLALSSNSGRHRATDSAATIGPTPAAAYAAEINRTPRPPSISLPSASSIFAPDGSSAYGNASHLRPPPSPGAELLLNGRPRPGLGSRTASSASIGVNMHKRAADFDLGEILGEGSYSTVFLATDKFPPHKQYALKVLDKKHIIKERKVKYVNVEKDTLARLDRHPGIVRLYWTFHDERSLYFVLELASSGEILKYIKEYGSFEVTSARFYAAQLLSSLEHMHKKGVIHRDVKPENILLDANMRIKVTDFGTAKLLPTSPSAEQAPGADEMHSRSNSFVGTAQYVSPELLTAKPLPDNAAKDPAALQSLPPPACADFWAFGCVLYQFICGQTPFRAPNEYLIFQKITRLDYTFPPDFPEDAKDLVSKLLVLDPFERLGARRGVEEIKEHAFFQSIDWATIWTCDVPAIKTGITAPTIFPKQLLVLEESSHDDDASEEDLEDDDRSSLAPIEDANGRSHPRLALRGDVPPLPDMLPPSPTVERRRESASSNYVPFPSIANVNSVNSGVTVEPRTYRSNNSSMRDESRPGSIMSGSSRRQDRTTSNEKNGNGVVLSETADRSRSRSTSGSRWSKLLNTFKVKGNTNTRKASKT